MLERRVDIETPTGTVTGRLVSVGSDAVVLVRDDGEVVSVRKQSATRVKVATDEPTADPPATDPPASDEASAEEPGSPEDAAVEDAAEPSSHRKLGLFTSHGIGYARFRTPGFRDGGAAYALDVAVGYNITERFGIYGLIGGHVGARINDNEARGHFGHFAVAFVRKWKYFAFIPGVGVGVSGIRGPDDARDRRVGFALPIKAMGLIPLPKELFLGIGLGYDLGLLPGGHVVNAIAFQVTVGRW